MAVVMMWSPCVLGRHRHAAQREVVGFGAAAGEDDLAGLRAERLGDGAAGGVEAFAGFAGLRVDAAGVAPGAREVGQHGGDDALVDGRGGGVVEVDAASGHGSIIAGCPIDSFVWHGSRFLETCADARRRRGG